MSIDLHLKAQDLLETLANSIHDREPKIGNPFFFTIHEINKAHEWLDKFVEELSDRIPPY
jgi:hypothetical protein